MPIAITNEYLVKRMKVRSFPLVFLLLLSVAYFTVALSQSPANTFIQNVNFKTQQNTDVYPGSSNAQLRVDVTFNVNATNPTGKLESLPSGITPSSGYGTSSGARDLYGNNAKNVTAGETVYFIFYLSVDKSVKPGTYYSEFSVTYITDGGNIETDYFQVPLTISEYPSPNIIISSVNWNPAGYPGVHGTSLQVTLENQGESSIVSATADIMLPSGMEIDNPQVQLGALGTGNSATVTFSSIDISEDLPPGNYSAFLNINALMQTQDGVSYNSTFNVPFTLSISSVPSKYKELSVLSAYWGDTRPQPVYGDSLYAQLNVQYINLGDYTIDSIQTQLSSPFILPVRTASAYSTPINGGGAATLNYYVSLNVSSIQKGTIPAYINVTYRVDLGGGAYLTIKDVLKIGLDVEGFPLGNGTPRIGLVSWGWYNGYSVFPNTKGAIFSITISNNLPYSISAANFTLLLPDGFSLDTSTEKIVVGNPIQSYGTYTMQFKMNVGGVSPGNYTALLLSDFIANSGGPGVKYSEITPIELSIDNLTDSIEVLNWGWKEGSVDVFSYGANYYITFRNLKFDGVSNPVLYVSLPNGFLLSSTNTSAGGILPSSPYTATPQIIPGSEVQQYIQNLLSGTSQSSSSSAPSTYSKGSSIYFSFPLNVMVGAVGSYYANATLSFIDAWGTLREYKLEIPLTVYGAINYIDVRIIGDLNIMNRYTNLTLEITNHGSSPAYNVYISLSPPSSLVSSQTSNTILLASPSTLYIAKLDANMTERIPVTFVYNPLGAQSISGATAIINYGVVPIQVSIQYKDAGGIQHSFNNQIALAIEPFIKLSLTQVSSSLSNGTLRVNGLVVNYGSQTAYRVTVEVEASNASSSYFIGDIDSGSQTAFSVQLSVPSNARKENVTVILTYYNNYNELKRESISFEVVGQPSQNITQTQLPQGTAGLAEIRVALAMVAVFLLLTGVLIYRMYRSHSRKLREMIEK